LSRTFRGLEGKRGKGGNFSAIKNALLKIVEGTRFFVNFAIASKRHLPRGKTFTGKKQRPPGVTSA